MSGLHAALGGIVTALGVGMTVAARGWPTRGQHRAPRRPVEEFVPGHVLIPALAYGAAVPQAFAYCRLCGGEVPVVLHDGAHRCDAGHITIHTTTGD